MSLEETDIQEVFAKVAEGKLGLVKVAPVKINRLEAQVKALEENSGNLGAALEPGKSEYLFKIEKHLALPENKELRQRWEAAIRLNIKIRMNLLRCKALDMLEGFENISKSSSAADVAFCKTILADVLAEGTERIKAKYGNQRAANTQEQDEADEADELAEQLSARND